MIKMSWADRWSIIVVSGVFLMITWACNSGSGDDATDDDSADDDTAGDTDTDTDTDADTDTGDDDDDDNDNDDTGDDDDDDPLDEYKPCPYDTRHGTFKIMLQSAQGEVDPFTGVEGFVTDIIKPSGIPIVLDTADECQLLQAPIYECDPPCTAVQSCGPDNECFDPPKNQDVGTITIEGCKDPVAMNPNNSNFYTNLDPLPQVGFKEGADIRFEAAGGDFEPFELRGRGINYLEAAEEPTLAEEGEPIELSWPTLSEEVPTRIRIEVHLNNHGPGIKTWIECEAKDTGALKISKDLVDGLFEAGISGWPSIVYWRQTADSTDISLGCVQFLVMTREGREIEFSDEISCTVDEDCPDGQICLSHMLCGEE